MSGNYQLVYSVTGRERGSFFALPLGGGKGKKRKVGVKMALSRLADLPSKHPFITMSVMLLACVCQAGVNGSSRFFPLVEVAVGSLLISFLLVGEKIVAECGWFSHGKIKERDAFELDPVVEFGHGFVRGFAVDVQKIKVNMFIGCRMEEREKNEL
ncbi:hypothetical protein NPIL_451721 [Nephila pilipes]|uniref:Uncharacterized protein n=1 Tax=Nephila pilipes TaxID=299642 RepID=A0A8X6NBJ3_NEPPI|nr:hypothetical protein NPIL_451721 [Nephila pilipes]